MIVYESNLNEFITLTRKNEIVARIHAQLLDSLGKSVGQSEKESWRNSLHHVARCFEKYQEKWFDDIGVLVEFALPTTKNRIDIIFTGESNNGSRNICVVELKQWSNAGVSVDKNNENIFFVNNGKGGYKSIHPSYQADDYVFKMRNYFDQLKEMDITGNVYMHNYSETGKKIFEKESFADVNEKVKMYFTETGSDFASNILEKVKFGKYKNINKILRSLEYKPSKDFFDIIKNQMQTIHLSESQRTAYEIIVSTITNNSNNKKVIFVKGAAGTGKTIVAFKILSHILSSNTKLAKLVMPGPELRESVKKAYGKHAAVDLIMGATSKTDAQILIIDEAHKANGNEANVHVNMKRYMENEKTLILFMDDKQVINKKGITIEEVKEIGNTFGYEFEELELTDQFRCGGMASYTEFLDHIIFGEENGQERFVNSNNYSLNVYENPDEFCEKYFESYEKKNVRIADFWRIDWQREDFHENGLPVENVNIGSYKFTWNPNWQYLSQIEKVGVKVSKELRNIAGKNFITDKKGKEFIAYFNTVQGAEFEEMFVHIPNVFFLNEYGELDVDISKLYIPEMKSQLWGGEKSWMKHKKSDMNKLYWKNRLKVLLTRATNATHVYIEDAALLCYFKKRIHNV